MSEFTEYTADDLLVTEAVPVDWYVCEITEFAKVQSKKGNSWNYELKGRILANEKGETKYARKITFWWGFNSQMIGYSKALWESLGVKIKPGQKVDWEQLVGRKVLMFIKQGMFNDQVVNQATNQYKPMVAA